MSDPGNISATPPTVPTRTDGGIVIIRNAKVIESSIPAPTRVEGTITVQNSETGEVRISTPKGEVVIQTDLKLPPDLQVRIDLAIRHVQVAATVSVARVEAELARQLQKIDPLIETIAKEKTAPIVQQTPLPSLEPGRIYEAIVMRAEPAPVAQNLPTQIPSQPPALTLQSYAEILAEKPAQIQAFVAEKIQGALQNANININQTDIENFIKNPAQIEYLPAKLQNIALTVFEESEVAQIFGNIAPTTPQSEQPTTKPVDRINDIIPFLTSLFSGTRPEQPATPVEAVLKTTQNKSGPFQPMISTLMGLFQQDPTFPTAHPLVKHGHAAPLPAENKIIQIRIQPTNAEGAHTATKTPVTSPQENNASIKLDTRQGIVDTVTPQGFAMIDTIGTDGTKETLILRNPLDIAPGTKVSIEVVAPTPILESEIPTTVKSTLIAAMDTFDPLRSSTWGTLEQTISFLQGSAHPQAVAAKVAIENSIPQAATPKMTATTLFFLAALRTGVIENWLGGTTIQALRDLGRRDLAERLGGDFGKLSASAKESIPGQGEWRSISIPIMHDETLNQMHLYVRTDQGHGGNDKDKSSKKSVRFLLDLKLSKMGDMQIDGLLRDKTFDTVLRTDIKLPEHMRRELMAAFAAGVEQSGMQGSLSFQAKSEKWITLLPPTDSGDFRV